MGSTRKNGIAVGVVALSSGAMAFVRDTPDTRAYAYCDGIDRPVTVFSMGGMETFQTELTCDGLHDYWGIIEDSVTDGKNVMVEYQHGEWGWLASESTRKGNHRVYYGYDDNPLDASQSHICRSSPFECGSGYKNHGY